MFFDIFLDNNFFLFLSLSTMNFTLIERPFSNVVVPKCCSLADAPSAKNKSAKSCIFNIGLVASDFKLKLRKKIFFPLPALVERSTLFFYPGPFHYVVYSRSQSDPATDGRGRSQELFFLFFCFHFFHIFTRHFNLMGNRTHFIYVLSSDFLMLKLV